MTNVFFPRNTSVLKMMMIQVLSSSLKHTIRRINLLPCFREKKSKVPARSFFPRNQIIFDEKCILFSCVEVDYSRISKSCSKHVQTSSPSKISSKFLSYLKQIKKKAQIKKYIFFKSTLSFRATTLDSAQQRKAEKKAHH